MASRRSGVCVSGGFEHGYDVLWRNIGEDIVNLLKDEAAVCAADDNLLVDMAPDLLWGCVLEHVTGIAAAAPEDNTLAKISLQTRQLHLLAGDLYRVDGFEAGVDEVAEQLVYSAA